MIIYKDLLTDCEMCSDLYKSTEEYGGQIMRIEAKYVTEKSTFDESSIGANKSAEDPVEDDCDNETSRSGINVALAHNLIETGYGKKKEFQADFSERIKQVAQKMKDNGKTDDEIKDFKAGVQDFIKKKVLPEFKEMQFFLGEDMESSIVFVIYEGELPIMYFIKECLVAEKV